MNGVVQGAEAVRSLVTYIGALYDSQPTQNCLIESVCGPTDALRQ